VVSVETARIAADILKDNVLSGRLGYVGTSELQRLLDKV
jgi:hypothetical protein